MKQRRQAIAEQIAEFTGKIAALRTEDKELEGAEVVLGRFVDEDQFHPANVTRTPTFIGLSATGSAGEVKTEGKPVGTPTTPNMILTLLREAAAENKPGLEPREMQMIIARRWWPGVKSEDIGPTAWRMWKESRLAKDGSLYMLPIETGIREAAGLPPQEEEETYGP